MENNNHKHTNPLILECSPYLLQHAHNPVHWRPWNAETLLRAKSENKPLIISIGYSACHWCHVMEQESFEDEAVAALMNEKFICIKVDREERPDVDHLYMNAIQLISGHGGWPLNMFALPDGRPFHGGTYFRKGDWIKVLEAASLAFETNQSELESFTEKLKGGIIAGSAIPPQNNENSFSQDFLKEMVEIWSRRFDWRNGGTQGSPKFPMPNNFLFLLQYSASTNDEELLVYVENTLTKMACGGLYDQIGGGFARYSTDEYWKVPHFEKMLYDNAQLMSLYSETFRKTGNPLYKKVIEQSFSFLMKDMHDETGAFYSAMDADSEGVEGKYYVWTVDELKDVLGTDYDLASIFYNVNKLGYWEHGNYILLRERSIEELSGEFEMTVGELNLKIDGINQKLLALREKRIKPGLDNKTLTSWNSLMVSGLINAYKAFGTDRYLDTALNSAIFIEKHQLQKDSSLFHNYKKGKSNISGFLEDYAFTAKAFLDLYEVTFDQKWLNRAKSICDYALEYFYDHESGFFYFSSKLDQELILRTTEIYDSVMPSSNSVMAHCLFRLAMILKDSRFISISEKMVLAVSDQMKNYGSGFSNWAMLYNNFMPGVIEVAIVGADALELSKELLKHYLPNAIVTGTAVPSELPLFQNRFVNGKTLIYVCKNRTCKMPVETVKEAVRLIKNQLHINVG